MTGTNLHKYQKDEVGFNDLILHVKSYWMDITPGKHFGYVFRPVVEVVVYHMKYGEGPNALVMEHPDHLNVNAANPWWPTMSPARFCTQHADQIANIFRQDKKDIAEEAEHARADWDAFNAKLDQAVAAAKAEKEAQSQ